MAKSVRGSKKGETTVSTVAVTGTRLPPTIKVEFEDALQHALGLDTPSTFFRLCAMAFLRHYFDHKKIKWPPVFELSADPLEPRPPKPKS
jgi:hypothetical protein